MSICLILYSCSSTKNNTLPSPEIKDGIAKLSGKITNSHLIGKDSNTTLLLIVPHPVTAEPYRISTTVNEDGIFSFEIPLQSNYAIGYIRPEMNGYDGFRVCLTSGKETKMNIAYKKPSLYEITNQTDSLGLTSTDLINIDRIRERLINYRSPEITGYAKTPDEFLQQMRITFNDKLKKISENDVLSETAKNFVTDNIKTSTLDWHYFSYREGMQVGYLNAGNKDIENFNPPEPDKNYYTFLKYFNLNNPQYLYQAHYFAVLQRILSNDILNIPPIGDMPVSQWIKELKKSLSKLVGFDKGLFYDLLAANSYAKQFNNELRPLSDRQKENIKNYFKDDKKEISKILLKKNDKIIQLAEQKEALVVNKTPAVLKESLMDAIISKHKGKVVVVDFWATWCGPCLEAMTKYRTIKGELQGKNVVFVYLTDESSPQKLWEEKIKGIGGEHYYIEKFDEWKYLMDTFGFRAIPSYAIFDTKGEICHKFTGYPGNEKMQTMIEKLLP